jgi:hypothetical protein
LDAEHLLQSTTEAVKTSWRISTMHLNGTTVSSNLPIFDNVRGSQATQRRKLLTIEAQLPSAELISSSFF